MGDIEPHPGPATGPGRLRARYLNHAVCQTPPRPLGTAATDVPPNKRPATIHRTLHPGSDRMSELRGIGKTP
jgi:hypothetical protein